MSGIFNASIFNNAAFNVGDVGATDVVKTGTGGIDPKKHKGIYKPLGTLGLPKKKVEQRVDDSRQIQAEVAAKLAEEFSEEIKAKPIPKMTMAEVEYEIGALLKKTLRTQEDETMLVLLMIAAAL